MWESTTVARSSRPLRKRQQAIQHSLFRLHVKGAFRYLPRATQGVRLHVKLANSTGTCRMSMAVSVTTKKMVRHANNAVMGVVKILNTTALAFSGTVFLAHATPHIDNEKPVQYFLVLFTIYADFGRICTEFRVLPVSVDFRNSMVPP